MSKIKITESQLARLLNEVNLDNSTENNQKVMDQLNKTYPAPAPQPIETKDEKIDIENMSISSERTNFKSFFPNKNIEYFRVGLYKYIYANKNNTDLINKLLKILYKP
jgi:hypothetical protein